MSFKNLLGLDLEQEMDVEGSLDVSVLDLEVSSLINTFLTRRLDVQSSVKSLEFQENILDLTIAGTLTPSLTLSSDWTGTARDLSNTEWNDAVTVSLYISLPLNGFIPGSKENLDIKDAKRDVEKARLFLKETMDSAEQDIRTLVLKLDGYRENMEITALSVELAQKTFEGIESAFNLGTREILDVEAAQNKLLSANQDLLQSRYSYLSGLLELEYALNVTIDEINGGNND
jgi:multidrug efflux system outer membrane protein